jgi:hypothetical protein
MIKNFVTHNAALRRLAREIERKHHHEENSHILIFSEREIQSYVFVMFPGADEKKVSIDET